MLAVLVDSRSRTLYSQPSLGSSQYSIRCRRSTPLSTSRSPGRSPGHTHNAPDRSPGHTHNAPDRSPGHTHNAPDVVVAIDGHPDHDSSTPSSPFVRCSSCSYYWSYNHSISIMPSRSRFIQSSACTTCPIFSFAEVVVCFRRCSGCSPRGCPLTVRFRCSRTPQVHCVVDAVPFAQGSTCSSTAPLARRRSLHVDRVAVCAPSQCRAAPTSCCSPSSAAVVDAAPRV